MTTRPPQPHRQIWEIEMTDLNDLWKFDLRRGNSDHPRNGACVMDAVSWFAYGKLGDRPKCACPVITQFAIGINDTLPDDERQRLKPFILRLMGSRDPASEQARAEYLAWQAIKVFAPLALNAVGLKDHANKLSSFNEADDLAAAVHAADAAYDAAHAAHAAHVAHVAHAAHAAHVAHVAHAADAAHAAAGAGADASAADAAHAAAAARAAHAADAAHAAGAGAGADASAAAVYDAAINALDGVLRIGKQSSEPDLYAVKQAVADFERARELVDA